jgi:surface protein
LQKNYICDIHNEKFNSFCNKCKKNICSKCEDSHKNENDIIYFKDLMKNEGQNKDYELKCKVDLLSNDIKEIIEKLNKLMIDIKNYSQLYYDFSNNYKLRDVNYQSLKNIIEFSKYSKKIKDEINKVINEAQDDKKIINLINLHSNLFSNEENIMKYEIKNKNNKIKIFGEAFIKNNSDKCKIVCNNKEYDLMEYFNVKKHKIDKVLKLELKVNSTLKDMSYMFEGCTSLISFSSNLNTSEVTNMSYMFKDCLSLSNLSGISNWKTNKVNDMKCMFYNCIQLAHFPDISKWDTNKVEYMNGLFYNCSSLTYLPDISKWNISNVNNMSRIFCYCESLVSFPDISKWDTNKVINMSYMFYGCKNLYLLPNISEWETANVIDMSYMFSRCHN